MIWLRQEHDLDGNQKMLGFLKDQGYRFKINHHMHQVWFGDEYLYGAGSKDPHKRKHYKHQIADLKMHLFCAVKTAYDHMQKKGAPL